MGKLAIVDTADVTVRSKKNGKVFMTSEAQLTSITQTLGINESIFGGIGSKKLFTFKGQKEVSTSIRNAFYDKNFLAMTQGVEVEEGGTVKLFKTEKELTVGDTGEVTISGVPINDEVFIRNKNGDIVKATASESSVPVPEDHAGEGDKVTITYKEETTGDVVEIDAEKFGESFEVEYRTIGYDPATNEVVVDIYIQLDNVVPDGEFEMSLENGTALAPEFNFDALASESGAIGRIVEVKRENGDNSEDNGGEGTP